MEVMTGATGCIGNVLVRELLRKDKEVRVLIRSTSDISSLEGLEIEKVLGNILDRDSLIKAFKGADIVYHLAAIISIMPGDRTLIRRINLEGTRNVIDACLKCGVKRLVYTSSIHALKEPPMGTIIDESMPFDLNSRRGEYDRSKALASLEVIKADGNGLDSVVVCPTGVLGPYDLRGSLMTQTFIDFARSKMKITISGAYDFVDVRDVAEGLILAAEKGRTGQYYILSGERITMDEMMSMLSEISGVQLPKYKVPIWLAKTAGMVTPLYYKLANKTPRFTYYSINTLQSNSYISHEKASRELAYNPRQIKKSIEDTFKWFREIDILT
ncbi:MAG: SDR family oxidoreductase [Actinobacteria bacterium]|nr:SDR family oxidoreductase [Actinomycetota bacterium]